MRTLKFRAWHKETKTLLEEETLASILTTEVNNGIAMAVARMGQIPGDKRDSYWSHLIWLQYTGLKDKNGKEIYEGDIIRRHGIYCEGELGFVEYSGCSFNLNRQAYSKKHNGASWLDSPEEAFDNSELKWCEVIGNIWENPELLKKEG